MNRFMIGLYESFDLKKYERDFRTGFFGIEACLFEREEDVERLFHEARSHGFRVGIHFPLRAGRSKLRDALFLAADDTVRAEAFELIERELAFLAKYRPSHVLFHYPKPVLLDDRVDWSKWRFTDDSEYAMESEYAAETFRELSESLFAWLSEQGAAYGFTPVLELDALNRYTYAEDTLETLLRKYSDIRLCLDTARFYLQDRFDPSFDAEAVLRRYARYANLVHLSNVRVAEDLTTVASRYPVLPDQSPADGWAPIERYLRIITEENADYRVLFEHRSDLVSEEELDTCYRWTAELMGIEGGGRLER